MITSTKKDSRRGNTHCRPTRESRSDRPRRARKSSKEARHRELSELRETRICARCKRPFQNRKKWQSRGLWPDIRYCSDRCRQTT